MPMVTRLFLGLDFLNHKSYSYIFNCLECFISVMTSSCRPHVSFPSTYMYLLQPYEVHKPDPTNKASDQVTPNKSWLPEATPRPGFTWSSSTPFSHGATYFSHIPCSWAFLCLLFLFLFPFSMIDRIGCPLNCI